MNFDGLIVAALTVAAIWLGHIWVVQLHRISGTKLWVLPLVLGALLTVGSLFSESTVVSAVLAIFGVTFFWGIKELFEYSEKASTEKN